LDAECAHCWVSWSNCRSRLCWWQCVEGFMGSKASAIAAPSFSLGGFSHTLRLHAKL
jgi:hypothetical protein